MSTSGKQKSSKTGNHCKAEPLKPTRESDEQALLRIEKERDEILRRKISKLTGRQRTLYAKAGVDINSISPLMILMEDAMQAEEERPAGESVELNPKLSTALGRNLVKYKDECGWSYDDLAHWANVDKKLILRQVNQGKRAYPSTLKHYAEAFTKKLDRTITVADLKA